VFVPSRDPLEVAAVMLGGEIDGLCSFQAAIRWRWQR
jgi:surfactin synthase thioesterase subunit